MSSTVLNYRLGVKRILTFMLPILVTMLTVVGMNAIDIIMSGQVGTDDLAGVAIGSNLFFPVYTGLNGIILALMTIIAHFCGAQKKQEIVSALRHGLHLAVIIAVLIVVVINIAIEYITLFITVDPNVYYIASGYIKAISWGMLPLCICNTLRQFIEALGKVRVITFVYLSALPINALVNYILIFGHCGAPKLGGIGAGYATSITYLLICCILVYICAKFPPFSDYRIFKQKIAFDPSMYKEQLRIGIPTGLSIFLEISIFSLTGLIMTKFGTVAIAANQSALNASTIVYMFSLSLSIALNIIISFELGRKNYSIAQAYSYLGLKFAACISVFLIVLVFVARSYIAQIYSSDPAVQSIIQNFIVYVLFYQFADAIMTPSQGILRAYKDAKSTFFICLIAYWLVCLPTGFVMDFYFAQGPYSYWQGFVSGMIVGAVICLMRIRYVHSQTLLKGHDII